MGRHLFIRDDDVWTLDKSFRFFFDLAIDHGLPVVYAVIPGKMDKGIVRFLRRAKEKTPHLLDIVQHGWVHANHAAGGEAKYEFGTSRSLKSQREDIQEGLKQMRLAFGEHFIPAFVPPYHGYDERTLQVLCKEGFEIFSAGTRRSEVKKQFIEMPAQVSFSRYDQGRARVHKAMDVIGFLAKGIYHRPIWGVVTHHADFATVASRKELGLFFDSIAAIENKIGWRVLLFSDLWRK